MDLSHNSLAQGSLPGLGKFLSGFSNLAHLDLRGNLLLTHVPDSVGIFYFYFLPLGCASVAYFISL